LQTLKVHRTIDKRRYDSPTDRFAFERVRRAERDYARKLRQLARQIGQYVDAFVDGDRIDVEGISRVLNRAAEVVAPWARSVAARMIGEVERRDSQAWTSYARTMGLEVRKLVEGPVGHELRGYLDEQVDLITSLPRDAAQRVHDITVGNLYQGARASEIAKQVRLTGDVTQSRVMLIARTEVARTASATMMIRAKRIGSTQYIWRTSKDVNVRPSHKRMEGKVCDWDKPPVVDPGTPPYHAGTTYNCRCVAEPIIPDDFE
jgi:SPP1 gp7 family putative phage head morphogenesis protein